MGTLLLIVVLSNFIMGFALAVYLHNPSRLRRKVIRGIRRLTPWLANEESPPDTPRLPADSYGDRQLDYQYVPAIDPFTGAPFEWLEELKQEQPRCTLEAAFHMIGKGARDYLRFLASLEELICGEGRGDMRPGLICQRLDQRGERWVVDLQKAAAALRTYCREAGGRGCDAELAFEEQLHDQVYMIESVSMALKKLRTLRDPAMAVRRFCVQIHRLAETTHQVRDKVSEELARRLETLATQPTVPQRRAADTKDTVEFARRLAHSRQKRGRSSSLLTVDVDRFDKLNAQIGVHGGDQLIASIDRLMQSICGVTHVSRLHGQTLAAVLPGSELDKPMRYAEQIRQTIEAATFDVGEQSVEFTVSCGVLAIDDQINTLQVIERVRRARTATKNAGRNQTAVDESGQITIIEGPPVGVRHSRISCNAVA